jgi:hypothetical protein
MFHNNQTVWWQTRAKLEVEQNFDTGGRQHSETESQLISLHFDYVINYLLSLVEYMPSLDSSADGRCRRSKMILDWIKEGIFLDFSSLANGVNRLSSIERSNETFRELLCPWRELLDGGPGHCRLRIFQPRFEAGLINRSRFFRRAMISLWVIERLIFCFNIWEFPGWILDLFMNFIMILNLCRYLAYPLEYSH